MGRAMTAWRSRSGWLAVAASAAWVLAPAPGSAAEKREASDGSVVKTADGLRFKLPPDWPVEKRNGIVSPIPVEEYLSKKLSAIESRLQQLEQQMVAADLRLRAMEEELKKQQRLRSGDQPRQP